MDVDEKRRAYLAIIDSHPHERIIVFCEFEETAKELSNMDMDRPALLITGSVPLFRREEVLRSFHEYTNSLLIMTSVGAEGIDLQVCSTMVNYDLTWNPMVLEQRIGRIDRIGQAKTEIHIYNLIVEGSIDEWIIRTLGRKLGLVEGSVLEPASVLERSPVQRLFFDRNLREEVGHADALANAMELSSTVIPVTVVPFWKI